MKKVILSLVISVAVSISTHAHAAKNYNVGNLLVGIGLGAGTLSVHPIGAPQMTINPSVELIVGSWSLSKVGIALGVTIDSSVNFFNGFTGSLAPMVTMHLTLAPRLDWYTSLGMGLQMLPATGTGGFYNIHVGFQTGFNVMITPAFFWYAGLAIHANQFFGASGVKIRFGNAAKIQYRK